MSTFANNVDPDEMPHNTAFHQGLHVILTHLAIEPMLKNMCYIKQ